jgi:hypothetical protein
LKLTAFHVLFRCRFCLRTLETSDKSKILDEEIRQSFKFVTHIDLKTAVKYSKLVCILCLKSLELAHAVIDQFSENQLKLESSLKSTVNEIVLPSTSSDPLSFSPNAVAKIPQNSLIKEEPEIDVIRYEPQIPYQNQDDNEMEYNDSDYQNVSWNIVNNRTGIKLNKEERVRTRTAVICNLPNLTFIFRISGTTLLPKQGKLILPCCTYCR